MDRTSSPRVDDEGIEQQIRAKGLTAPRVTIVDIEAEIASQYFFTAMDAVAPGSNIQVGDEIPLSLLTFCVLVLKNGFTVTGESACASHENFDADIGRRIARANAVNKVWLLLGFRLKDALNEV